LPLCFVADQHWYQEISRQPSDSEDGSRHENTVRAETGTLFLTFLICQFSTLGYFKDERDQ